MQCNRLINPGICLQKIALQREERNQKTENVLFFSDPHADLILGLRYVKSIRCFPKHFEEQVGYLEAERLLLCVLSYSCRNNPPLPYLNLQNR